MCGEIREAEEYGEGFLEAKEAPEGPFTVELEDGEVLGRAEGGDVSLAGVVAFVGAGPEEEAEVEGEGGGAGGRVAVGCHAELCGWVSGSSLRVGAGRTIARLDTVEERQIRTLTHSLNSASWSPRDAMIGTHRALRTHRSDINGSVDVDIRILANKGRRGPRVCLDWFRAGNTRRVVDDGAVSWKMLKVT